MKKILSLLVLFLLFSSSCKIHKYEYESARSTNLAVANYVVMGEVRIEGKISKPEVTYDGLLKKARYEYGKNTDVINVRIDRIYHMMGKDRLILNGTAIQYK